MDAVYGVSLKQIRMPTTLYSIAPYRSFMGSWILFSGIAGSCPSFAVLGSDMKHWYCIFGHCSN